MRYLRLAFAGAILLASKSSFAQMTTVTASQIEDASQAPLVKGTICFQSIDSNTHATPFGVGPTGNAIGTNVCRPVVAGVMQGALTLADSMHTRPIGISYQIVVTDGTTGLKHTLGATPITGPTWDLGQWASTAVLTAPPAAWTAGPQGPPGNDGAPGKDGAQGPIGAPTSGVNLTPSTGQTVAQPYGTSLYANHLAALDLHSVFPDSTPGLMGFGDSNMVGIGTTTGGGTGAANVFNADNSNAYFTIVARALGGAAVNCAEGGSQSADGTAQLFGKRGSTTGCSTLYAPNSAKNPLVAVHLGTNAWYQCAATGGVSAGCLANEAPAHRTMITWPATTNKVFATTGCTFTGTWNADAYLPQYAKTSTAQNSTATCSITVPAGAAGLAVHWEAAGTTGSYATVTIDGTLVDNIQNFGFNGQTVTTGYIGTSTAVWTNIYPVSPGTHSVAIKPTSASGIFTLVGLSAPDDPAKRQAGAPRVVSDGVPQQSGDTNSAFTASLNSTELANVQAAQAAGYPVVFNDFRAVANVPCDLAASTYTYTDANNNVITCAASTQPGAHLSDHGHATNAASLLTAIGGGGSAFSSPVSIPANAGDYGTFNSKGLISSTALNPGWCAAVYSGRLFCMDLGWVPSTLMTPAAVQYIASYATRIFAPTGNYIEFGFYPDSPTHPTLQTQITPVLTLSPVAAISLVPMLAPSIELGTGITISSIQVYSPSLTPASVAAQSCVDQNFTVAGLLIADSLTQVASPSALGNLSVSAGHSAVNTLTLHFCNPSIAAVTLPPGVYSFMAIH